MRDRATMRRDEAAALLGVRADASSDDVRHAWRMWARIAHPDRGGDPSHFARLDEARRVLVEPAPAATPPPPPPAPDPGPSPRRAWSEVLRRPARPRLLVATAILTVLLAAAPAALQASTTLDLMVTALPAAICAAAWAAFAVRQVLAPAADAGHVITMLFVLWVPIAVLQQVVSALAGASLLPILPVLATPLVAAVAVVNPGAGLWRPIQAPRRW